MKMIEIPHCDIETGKIYNCNPYSRIWWHEKGHLEFSKSKLGSGLQMCQGILFDFWMLSITLAMMNKYMLWIALPIMLIYLGIDIYEEHWCNKYARYYG